MIYIADMKKLIISEPHEVETVVKLVKDAGMELLACYDAFTREPVKEDSERIYIVARRKMEENNE